MPPVAALLTRPDRATTVSGAASGPISSPPASAGPMAPAPLGGRADPSDPGTRVADLPDGRQVLIPLDR